MDADLRKHVVYLLEDGGAHMTLLDAVAEFPENSINQRAPNLEYSFWQLLEHIRITQWDILEFCTNPKYKTLDWPEKYWPPKDTVASKADWDNSILNYQKDLRAMINLVEDPKTDLFAKIIWGEGQTILREALLVADHSAYHIGEFGILRQIVKNWPKGHE